ncbi:amino acid ABC transporter ATP-binding protein [Agromyces silvae]|uniref:amino acid ABC transporter ATP-binding protein n=1 Tax=Agromyces silvae TaxID=3388266 RepID=UPI00280B9E07|nr:amino acid ABC transporter ATP-binding protein [Agromyces protaetiae]
MTVAAAPVISIDRIVKRFGDHTVLDDVSLEISPGEVVVVVGPSGSGKSTLCRCINGLETIEGGSITVEGRPLPTDGRELTALRARLGMVFQQFNLFPHLSVLENVTLAPRLVSGRRTAETEELGLRLLDRVGLAAKAHDRPAALSGGQQQRVAIARALAMEPTVLLFDEPTSALDPETIHEVLDVMTALAADGTTMLVVTHEMGFARRAADRVVFMADGRIVEQSTPEAFFGAPESARAREFLSRILPH